MLLLKKITTSNTGRTKELCRAFAEKTKNARSETYNFFKLYFFILNCK